MSARLRAFFKNHPVLREVLLWSLPALLVGGALRVLLLSYLPYGYWGSDSKSYYSFAHMLLTEGYVSLDEKRRLEAQLRDVESQLRVERVRLKQE